MPSLNSSTEEADGMSNYDLVNTFYGVDPPGNCLPGPYRPFGLVRLSPDVAYGHPTSGYRSNRPIITFSHTHVSGTGGGGRYGNVGLMPFPGRARRNGSAPFLQIPIENRSETVPLEESGSPGYYTARLFAGAITVELTATHHVGLHRYTFDSETLASLLLSGGAVINAGAQPPGEISPAEPWNSGGVSCGGYIEAVSPTEIIGRSDFRGGWGHHKPYSVYFALHLGRGSDEIELANRFGIVPAVGFPLAHGEQCTAALTFRSGQSVLDVAVGISFVSVADARESIEREVGGRGFDAIREEARREWSHRLSTVETSGSEAVRRIFASSHHRLLCMPTDLGVDAQNPFWKSGVRQFTDIYCLWDSVRNANSLLFLLEPQMSRDLLNALVDIGEHTGWIPDASIACRNAYMQSGGSAPILFREAAAKGIAGVAYERALALLRKESEELSPDPMIVGRYNECYNELGYVSDDAPKSRVSRHIEYAYYDWCIGKLAEHLGDSATAEDYAERSRRLWSLWHDGLGAFAPKNRDGTWDERYLPGVLRDDLYNDPYFYESSGESWSFNTFQDFPALISRLGGSERFVTRLDEFFEKDPHALIPKETRMHLPLLYTYAGRPDRTAEIVHAMLKTQYADARNGLPDNEDMGCQSAFYMLYTAGMYPIMGQDLYILTPPVLERTVFGAAGMGAAGARAAGPGAGGLGAAGVDAGPAAPRIEISAPAAGYGTYIDAVRLNGTSIDRLWFRHAEVAAGARIELDLIDHRSAFGFSNSPPAGE